MVAKDTAFSARRRAVRPLDREKLEQLALAYVARFATSSAKLESYLHRKLRERGFEGGEPQVDRLVERYVELAYVDDAAYARAKSGDLQRRGYGPRRIDQALRAAGIDEDLREETQVSESDARQAAAQYARRRRFGPFGERPDPARREKQIAAMIRAGHSFDAARAVVDAQEMELVEEWVAQAEEME